MEVISEFQHLRKVQTDERKGSLKVYFRGFKHKIYGMQVSLEK